MPTTSFCWPAAEGDIVEANDRAVETYGWSREELLRMHVRDLRDPTADGFAAQWMLPGDTDSVRFETRHRRRDDSVFPVEVSGREIRIGEQVWRQAIIRDISERVRAERELLHLKDIYAALSATNEAIVRLDNEAELLARIVRVAVETAGLSAAWIGLLREGHLLTQAGLVTAIVSRRPPLAMPTMLLQALRRPGHRCSGRTTPASSPPRGTRKPVNAAFAAWGCCRSCAAVSRRECSPWRPRMRTS